MCAVRSNHETPGYDKAISILNYSFVSITDGLKTKMISLDSA